MKQSKIDSKIEIKDIHDTLWRCRDFELSNLWQRSIFLTAFLVLCFTAYGSLLINLTDNPKSPLTLNLIAYAISLLGISFSILWIKMSKGSKAWYEVYENAILAMEQNNSYSTQKAAQIGGFRYSELPNYRKVDMDNSIFSTKAGEYSVSKINIGIGRIFLLTWFSIGLIHTILVSFELHLQHRAIYCILTAHFGILGLLAISFLIGLPYAFKSGDLNGLRKP